MRREVRAEIDRIAGGADFAANPCFYIHDLAAIRARLREMEAHLPSTLQVYYAMKANPHPRVLSELRRHPYVRGVEIASGGELARALEVYRADQILFTGPGKTNDELARALRAGIRQIHVESRAEAVRIDRLVAELGRNPADILIRVNIQHHVEGAAVTLAGGSSRFGIDEEALPEAALAIRALPGVRLRGLHLFAASGVLDHEVWLSYLRHCLELATRLAVGGAPLEVLDFGGGFGIDYAGSGLALDLAELARGASALVAEYGLTGTELVLELGKYLVGEAGWYVTEIVDIKVSRGVKQVVCAGGINHQRRPMMHGINHPTFVLPREAPPLYAGQPRVRDERVEVGGPLCSPRDVLARDLHLERADIGDLLVVGHSGAYGLSVALVDFLGHPTAPEYFVE